MPIMNDGPDLVYLPIDLQISKHIILCTQIDEVRLDRK